MCNSSVGSVIAWKYKGCRFDSHFRARHKVRTAMMVKAKKLVEDSLVVNPADVWAAIDGPPLRSVMARRRAVVLITKYVTRTTMATSDGLEVAVRHSPTSKAWPRKRWSRGRRPGRSWRSRRRRRSAGTLGKEPARPTWAPSSVTLTRIIIYVKVAYRINIARRLYRAKSFSWQTIIQSDFFIV